MDITHLEVQVHASNARQDLSVLQEMPLQYHSARMGVAQTAGKMPMDVEQVRSLLDAKMA